MKQTFLHAILLVCTVLSSGQTNQNKPASTHLWDNFRRKHNSLLNKTNSQHHREEKILSMFSIVSFQNFGCSSTKDGANGTCLSPSDCSGVGGTAEGTCASGFGICCIQRVQSCGATVDSNTTLLQNPGYPGAYTTASTCKYIIKKTKDDVCQIRLDFLAGTFNYASSSTTGCVSGTTDYLSFTLKNGETYDAVCGTMLGQHMYYEVGSEGDTLEVSISLTGTDDRRWNILVSQICCNDPWRAPADCLQYHTGVSGTFKSFNHEGGQVLSSQNYRVCFRQEQDYCSITYQASTDTSPDSFELLTEITGGTTMTTNCQDTYLGIPIGGDTGNNDSGANRYCGSYFSSEAKSTSAGSVTSTVAPFDVYFFSDSAKTDKSPATGFSMKYRQNGCGT